MRVLTVGNLYPPHHFGGYEQVWASAVAHLRDRGHEVRVLATTYRRPGVCEPEQPDVHRVLRWYWEEGMFDIPGTRMKLLDRLRLEKYNQRQLTSHLADFSPDVVSFWSMGGMSHSLIETVRVQRAPIVAFVHDEWLSYSRHTDQWTRLFSSPARRRIAPLVTALTGLPTTVDHASAGRYVFVSDFIRRAALRLPHAPREHRVAHSGIDPSFLGPLSSREWEWKLLFVGRLDPKKGVEDAVAALADLPPEATLTVAGSWDGDDERTLTRLVDKLGLAGRVTMLGQLSHEALAPVYREHSALLFPVRWEEPWGLVPLEAMACGCPVVATGRGGSSEYLNDERNCLLFPAGDTRAMAACVRRLAASADLRSRLRQGGIETAPKHTEPIFNIAVERNLREVANVPGAAPGQHGLASVCASST